MGASVAFEQRRALSLFAFVTGLLLGLAIYFPSNTSIEMLSLSGLYFDSTTEAEKALLIASGQTLTSIWKGSADESSGGRHACALSPLESDC